jgi:hypothetical protein
VLKHFAFTEIFGKKLRIGTVSAVSFPGVFDEIEAICKTILACYLGPKGHSLTEKIEGRRFRGTALFNVIHKEQSYSKTIIYYFHNDNNTLKKKQKNIKQ